MHTLFVVENSPTTLKSLDDLFSSKGFTVTRATTAREALENKNLSKFACIVTTLDFEDYDSEKYIQELLEKAPVTPVITLASHINVAKTVETLQKGVFHIVKKPILLKEVEKAVLEAVSSKEKVEEIQGLSGCLNSQMVFEIPGALGLLEGTIDLIAEETFQWPILPSHEETSFRSAVRAALHNAVLHGNKGNDSKKVKVRYTLTPKGCFISVTDEGEGFHPEDYINTENLSESKSSGGLIRIYSYMDKVTFNARHNQIRMSKFAKR